MCKSDNILCNYIIIVIVFHSFTYIKPNLGAKRLSKGYLQFFLSGLCDLIEVTNAQRQKTHLGCFKLMCFNKSCKKDVHNRKGLIILRSDLISCHFYNLPLISVSFRLLRLICSAHQIYSLSLDINAFVACNSFFVSD